MQYKIYFENGFYNAAFSSVPSESTREFLKAHGFRWFAPKKVWYSKTESNVNALKEFLSNENSAVEQTPEQKQNTAKISLFKRLQIFEYSSIDKQLLNDDKTPKTNFSCALNKLLAKEAKNYLTNYFKDEQLKLSITSDYNSINTYILSSIFEKNDKILKDIKEFCKKWLDGFNYNNSDIMSDYFDVGFYGNYFQLKYNYQQTACTTLSTIQEQYNQEKEQDEQEKHAAWQKQYEIEQEQARIEREKAEKIRQENDKKLDTIKLTCQINDLTEQDSYIYTNCIENIGKESLKQTTEYLQEHENERKKIDMQIAREIHLDNLEQLDLLYNYYYLDDILELYANNDKHFGGSATFDKRINTFNDYTKLTKEQRETIKFYAVNCIAVYVNNELKLIVNCEGYNYARYMAFTTETSEKMSFKDYEAKETKQAETKQDFYIPKNIVEQVEQAKADGLLVEEQEQVITIISDANWYGSAIAETWKLKQIYKTKYAQYDNAIYLSGKPKKDKRFSNSTYYKYIYGSNPKCIILNGLIEIPDSVKYEEIKEINGFICKTSIMGNNVGYWQRLKAWLKEQNITPIIDTVAA